MLLSAKSLLAALESALVTGLSTFAASLTITNGTVELKDLIAGATAAGIAVLYSFTKSLGALQAGAAAPSSTVAPVVTPAPAPAPAPVVPTPEPSPPAAA